MYVELLKQLYYRERKKLQDMQVFKQESKLKLLRLKEDIITKAGETLTISEIEGRSDIKEEIKDKLLRDRHNADKITERLDAIIAEELTDIDNEEKEELKNASYSPSELAEYLLQLEKVNAIENELGNNRLFPDDVYNEQKETAEGKEGAK